MGFCSGASLTDHAGKTEWVQMAQDVTEVGSGGVQHFLKYFIFYLFFLNFLVYIGVCVCCVLSCVTPQTAACQVPLSMEFPRKEYWSGLPFGV